MSIFKKYSNYEQNHGVSGVVYILTNPGLREGFLKIGCSRYSGKKRAEDLNLKANTGTPGTFKCIYEKKTQDCGRAEQEVFKILAKFRRGKKYQEFFEVSSELARNTIDNVCNKIDGAPTPEDNMSLDKLPGTKNIIFNEDLKSAIFGLFIIAAIFFVFSNLRSCAQTSDAPIKNNNSYLVTPEKPSNEVSDKSEIDESLITNVPETTTAEINTSISSNHNQQEEINNRVRDKEHDANLAQCLDGRYPALCNHSILYGEEIELVRKREHDANLAQCLDGRYPALCNHSILYGEEIQRVKKSEYNANLKQCLDGRYPTLCNRVLLNEKIE